MSYRQEIHGQQALEGVDERGLATPDELMEKAERAKRLEMVSYKILQSARQKGVHLTQDELRELAVKYVADQDVWRGLQRAGNIPRGERQPEPEYNPPDPVYTEEEKRRRARESWEYNKMTQDLQGEVPPDWQSSTDPGAPIRINPNDIPEYPAMREWKPIGVARAEGELVIEDEALRRDIREALQIVRFFPGDGGGEITPPAAGHLREALDVLVAKVPELLGRYEALFTLAEQVAKLSPVDRHGVYRSQRPKENTPGTTRMEE